MLTSFAKKTVFPVLIGAVVITTTYGASQLLSKEAEALKPIKQQKEVPITESPILIEKEIIIEEKTEESESKVAVEKEIQTPSQVTSSPSKLNNPISIQPPSVPKKPSNNKPVNQSANKPAQSVKKDNPKPPAISTQTPKEETKKVEVSKPKPTEQPKPNEPSSNSDNNSGLPDISHLRPRPLEPYKEPVSVDGDSQPPEDGYLFEDRF